MRVRIVLPLLAAVLLLAGCASDGGNGDTGTRPATTGDLAIVEPAPGAVFPPDSVPVRLTLTGATILEEASTNLTPDTGHVHVKLGDKVLSLLAGLEFDLVTMTDGPIDPGTHLLEVEFVAADHGPFSPREIEVVTFTVQG